MGLQVQLTATVPAMTSKRPGFSRANTDRAVSSTEDIELQHSADAGVGNSKGTSEFRDPDAKDGAAITVESAGNREESPPGYEDDGDEHGKVTEPVETAKDLVTQVLHVDDDPTLNPFTFRVFFLGA